MMEPAAPGTEDEIKLPVHSVSKKETEQERLLSIRTRLPSGKLNNVFELSFSNGSERWYCNLCECPIMGRVYHHEIGKRHTNNMQLAGTPHVPIEPEPALQIAPGEPVPPGFEGEMQKVAEIQERLDSFTVGPLIGLEYLFEVQEDRDKEPSYLCLLCDKRGDPRTVIAHLASYNHITQYTQRHFITCFRALSPYITKQYKRNWQATMQKIAEAIENKFGRLKPHVVDRETFEAKRTYYQSLVAAGPHFNERCGVTFEELVDKEQLTRSLDDQITMTKLSQDVAKRAYRKSGTEPSEGYRKLKRSPSPPVVAKPKKSKPAAAAGEKRRASLSSVSSMTSSELSDFDPAQHPLPKRSVKKEFEARRKHPVWEKTPYKKRRSRSRSHSTHKRYDKRSRSRSHSPPSRGYDKHRGRSSLHPWQRSDYIRSRNDSSVDYNKQKSDKLEEFKRLSNAIENDMERIFKQHEKNPEKHPQYNEEWKQFWNRRYKELQAEGKDATNYDFKPEWIEFWNKRMLELHSTDIKTKKDALRKRLGLPEEPNPISFKITGGRKKSSHKEDSKDSKPVPIASVPDQDPDIIIIEDKDEDTISSKRSHSPWESEPGSRPNSRRSRERSREISRDKSKERVLASRDRSRERSHRSHDRSRSRSRDRWHPRNREKEYHRDLPPHEKAYYRDVHRKHAVPEYLKPPRVMRDVTRHPVLSPPLRKPEPPEPELDDEEVNIVGVLRLLTALEEKLGSLGPKIIVLLGKALAMEKSEANSSETLIDNEVNCVLFETVKEKLKGQLLAGLVDYNQEKAFKKAIKKIASLIHFASERKKEKEKEKQVDPIKVPGVGTVDKGAIAKQIATALVLQGKTDVSQAELEQLINAVVGMAEASRTSNKPMTTASFLQQLTQAKEEIKLESPFGLLASTLQSSTVEAPATSTNSMEGLSDSDLQTLLQNFKDLCTDEQHSLISYLKKLEAKEPERVERLRKFVNLDANPTSGEKGSEKSQPETGRRGSPFASRLAGLNPTVEEKLEKEAKKEEVEKGEKPITKINLDSDDEEYSFEDVFKAANKNVKEKEEKEKKERKSAKPMVFKTEDFDLSNAESLIANIMGQFRANNNESKSTSNSLEVNNAVTPENLAPIMKAETPTLNVPLKLDNFPINLNNLTSALNIVRQANADASKRPVIAPPLNPQQNQLARNSVQPNVGANQQNSGFELPGMGQNLPNITQNIPNMPQNVPNMAQNVKYPMRPQNHPTHQGHNNYPQNISYPQQNPYMNPGTQFGNNNNFNRPNFDQNRYQPVFGSRDGNPNQLRPRRPGPGQFDNYENRW